MAHFDHARGVMRLPSIIASWFRVEEGGPVMGNYDLLAGDATSGGSRRPRSAEHHDGEELGLSPLKSALASRAHPTVTSKNAVSSGKSMSPGIT
jgi:hypothetical protein